MIDLDEQSEAEAVLASKSKNASTSGNEGILTVDVFKTENDIVIQSTIAGVGADDIDISVTNDTVTIKGARKTEERVKDDDYYYQELYWGTFSRTIILPEEIDADQAKANIKNGILTLRLPRLSKTKTKKIKVSS